MELGIGRTEFVSSAQKDGSSTPTMSASLFLTNAKNMPPMVTAPLASKDMTSSMVNAFSLSSTTPDLLILDVVSGTGMLKYALDAPTTGSRTLMASVYPFLINAPLMLKMETALLASRVMTYPTDNAYSLKPTTLNLPISDADCGTGLTKFVSSALMDSFSTSTKSVLPPLIFAELLTVRLVTALLATKDMTLKTDSVSTLPQIMPDLQILAVLLGTGKTRSA